jgi:hypothetical protein
MESKKASNNVNAKLTENDIALIQEEIKKQRELKKLLKEFTYKEIGKRFGVSRRSIANLDHGRCYKTFYKRNEDI